MGIASLDHLVLTVRDLDATVSFYEGLGMRRKTFGDGRLALHFGSQKLNLHEAGKELDPKATHPVPGSADLCFLVDEPLDLVVERLGALGVAIVAGPGERAGATGPIRSVYVRDPDGNLVELSERIAEP